MRPSGNGGGVATAKQIMEAAFGETDAEVFAMSKLALDKPSSETYGPNHKCCIENQRSKFYLKSKRDGNGVIIGLKKRIANGSRNEGKSSRLKFVREI